MSSASIGLRFACVRHVLGDVVPPHIAAGLHLDRVACSLEDDHVLDQIGHGAGFVDVVLQRNNLAAPVSAVRRDDHVRLGVHSRSTIAWAVKPPKMTECAAPMRAQASMAMASSGIIGQVQRDTIALLDAQLLQAVGELADVT